MGESSASSLGRVGEVQDAMVPAIRKVNVATTRTESIDGVGHGLRNFGTRAQNGARKDYLVTRHKLLSQFVLLFLPDQRPYIVNNICICTHTYLTVYRLYMNYRGYQIILQRKPFYTSQEQCEVLTG